MPITSASGKDEDPTEFCHRLKELRQSLNYTQAEMAFALGIQPARYNKYEIGRSQAPYELLTRLTALFGTDIHYLVTGSRRSAATPERAIPVAVRDTVITLPVPAALFDAAGRLVTNNALYIETFFHVCPRIVRPGTSHELLIRSWAHSCGLDQAQTDAFVQTRLGCAPVTQRRMRYKLGEKDLHIAEHWHDAYKLVLASAFAQSDEPA